MALPEPTIDDRSYQQILDEALARIPVHNPEWTNYTESDPGVTMLQVFAFMTESLLYRANLVPERNRIKFLRLLGLDRMPATVAQGLVTFESPRGPLTKTVLDADAEVSAGPVPFRTRNGLRVLPITSRAYYKAASELSREESDDARALYERLYESYRGQEADASWAERLQYYETTPLEAPKPGAPLPTVDLNDSTVAGDQSLWLALLARTPDEVDGARELLADGSLTLAVVPALPDAQRSLAAKGDVRAEDDLSLVFEIPRTDVPAEAPTARYRELDARASTNVLLEPGVVELRLPDTPPDTWTNLDPLEPGVGTFPPSLEETNEADRLITWIRIRPRSDARDALSSLPVRFSFVGINGAEVEQRSRVEAELLGKGTGAPDQSVQLVNTPVLPDSLTLTVNGEVWQRVDDLLAAPPEVPRRDPRDAPGTGSSTTSGDPKVFTLDADAGRIQFGDGLRGKRPPAGALIQARYDYGGGRQGVVGIGAISTGAALPPGISVRNPIRTWGGAAQESVAAAQRRIAGYLKRRDRLVTASDFVDITRRTPGVEMGRVEVLPLQYPEPQLSDVRADGVVTIMVIPASDPSRPDAPVPDRLFLNTVCDYLDTRRLLTTELYVRGPEYVPVYVAAGVELMPGVDRAPVLDAIRAAIRSFLSPLNGGFENTGWPLRHVVSARELLTVVARVSGVSGVVGVRLAEGDGTEQDEISLRGVMLPRLAGLSVQTGEPGSIDQLRGTGSGGDGAGDGTADEESTFLPIPIVPSQC